MKKLLASVVGAVLLLTATASAQQIGPAGGGSTIVTILTNAACTASPNVCGLFFGYSNIAWYGGTCPVGGGHDDTPAMKLAMTAAAAGGWNTVALPAPPAKCLFLDNLKSPANGFLITVAGAEFGKTYDGNHPSGTVAYMNNAYQHGTYNGLFDLNGFTDFYTSGFTILSDGASYGGVGIYDSFNTISATFPQPVWHGRNMSFTQLGNSVGCDVKVSGVASGPPQCSASGLGNNLITGDCVNCDVNEGGVASLGNVADLRWNGGDVAGMYGGFFANVGDQNLSICPDRIENSGALGISGMFTANLPMVGVNGPGWEVCSNAVLRQNQGAAYGFYTGASNFKTMAHEEGNGIGSGVEMADFEVASGSPTVFDFTGVTVGAVGQTPATHLTQNGGAVPVIYNMTGGGAGAIAYSGTRDNASVSAITANIRNVLNEQNYTSGGAVQNLGTWTCGNSTGCSLHLNNTSSNGRSFSITNTSQDVNSTSFLTFTDDIGFVDMLSMMQGGGGLSTISSGCYGMTNDPNYSGSGKTRDTKLCRVSAGMLSSNGAIVNTGTHFTLTGGSYVSGGATGGTFTSGTTGTMSAVVTLNGATGLTAPTGWDCHCTDFTTAADALLCKQTASSATTATLGGTTVSADVISFNCQPY